MSGTIIECTATAQRTTSTVYGHPFRSAATNSASKFSYDNGGWVAWACRLPWRHRTLRMFCQGINTPARETQREC
eukprot:5700372-Amphidinium_carterae.1